MTAQANRYYFVGAGSFARELASWTRIGRGEVSGSTFGGFLSDDAQALAAYPAYRPGVVGTIEGYLPKAGDGLVMAIADPKAKLRIADLLLERGANFLNFVHPTAVIADYVTFGLGVVICPNSAVSCHASIGDFTTINLACSIGHDVKLGRGCTLSAHVDVTGFANLGDGVFVGSHASILPEAKIGAFACIGAGSVVLRSAKAGTTVMGVPARQIYP